MDNYLSRSSELLGNDIINSFSNKTILIFGLGGVGGTAFVSLLRSGFKKFIIVDKDVVEISNLNRQILFMNDDIGKDKVLVAKEYAQRISSDIEIETYKLFVDSNSINDFANKQIDFIVDAIDFIPGKISISKFALENNIPFIVSLGMANRLNPEDVTITSLNKTENDPLAKKLRYEFRQNDILLKDINVIFSKEQPLKKCIKPSSMIMVPSTAGLLIAKYIINKVRGYYD